MSSDVKNTISIERRYIRQRNLCLSGLAFTSIVSTYAAGGRLAEALTDYPVLAALSQFIIVFIVYSGFDGSLKTVMIDISNGNTSRKTKNFSIGLMAATLIFSIASSFFIGESSKGKSNYLEYNNELIAASKRDSTNKALAAITLKDLNKSELNQLSNAKRKAYQLELNVVNRGSKSWKSDYKKAKNNPSHWLWKCTGKNSGCPKEYREWRDDILNARLEGQNLISMITGNNIDIKNGLSKTLSYRVDQDSSLIKLGLNVSVLEKERNANAGLLFYLLILICFLCAIGAYFNNDQLTDLRARNGGAKIKEEDSYVMEMLTNLGKRLLSLSVSVIVIPLGKLESFRNKYDEDGTYKIVEEKFAKYDDVIENQDRDNRDSHSFSMANLDTSDKPITASVPVQAPPPSNRHNPSNVVRPNVTADSESRNVTNESHSVTPFSQRHEVVTNLTLINGEPTEIWNGVERPLTFFRDTRRKYEHKVNNGKDTPNNRGVLKKVKVIIKDLEDKVSK